VTPPPDSPLDAPVIPDATESPAELTAPGASEAEAAPVAPPPRATVTLAGFQTVVGLTGAMISILGTLMAVTGVFTAGPGKGEVVAVIMEAKSDRAVSGAIVEILTPGKAPVATLPLNALGQASFVLVEGPYQLRVSHPQYAAAVRQLQVLPGQTAEIRVRLRAGASGPLGQVNHASRNGLSSRQPKRSE
jgi:hypothetical protein